MSLPAEGSATGMVLLAVRAPCDRCIVGVAIYLPLQLTATGGLVVVVWGTVLATAAVSDAGESSLIFLLLRYGC
jgi:hypothetical protein